MRIPLVIKGIWLAPWGGPGPRSPVQHPVEAPPEEISGQPIAVPAGGEGWPGGSFPQDGDTNPAPTFAAHSFIVGELRDGEFRADPKHHRVNPYEAIFLRPGVDVVASKSVVKEYREEEHPRGEGGKWTDAPGWIPGIGTPDKPRQATSFDADSAIKNTPGARQTKDGIELNLLRFQDPNQAGELSIRSGVFFLPEHESPWARHYRSDKIGYGGSMRVTGSTVLKNPIIVRASTGGRGPELAYDQIMGKGAYEAMRTEVLKSTVFGNAFGSPEEKIIEHARGVLEKYGGDPSMAKDIVQHSRGGNLLPYAIQEHIVAHAVRRAGHDSILSWSKHKGAPRLSEVFDLKQTHYPSESDMGVVKWTFKKVERQPLHGDPPQQDTPKKYPRLGEDMGFNDSYLSKVKNVEKAQPVNPRPLVDIRIIDSHTRGRLDKDFDESEHPRDEDGKFTDTPGGGIAVEDRPAPEDRSAPRVFMRPGDLIRQEEAWGGGIKWVIRDPETGKPTGEILSEPIAQDNIPEKLYHATTNLPAIEASGILFGRHDGGGLGGGVRDGVSLTTSQADADLIAHELRRSIGLAKDPPPDTPSLRSRLENFAREDEARGGVPASSLQPAVDFAIYNAEGANYLSATREWNGESWESSPLRTGESLVLGLASHAHDAYSSYLTRRQSVAQDVLGVGYKEFQHDDKYATLKNPIVLGDVKILRNLDPGNIGVVSVDRESIPAEALTRKGTDDFLHEIRVHADIPLKRTKALAKALGGKAVAIDFDGTITVDEDGTENPRVRDLVAGLVAEGVRVVVFTARDAEEVREWLAAKDWPALEVTNVKSPDFAVMLDDRAVRFDPSLVGSDAAGARLREGLSGFKAWWEKSAEVRKHLPGQHDQESHGDRGAGIGASLETAARGHVASQARVSVALNELPDGYEIKASTKTWAKQTIAGDVFWIRIKGGRTADPARLKNLTSTQLLDTIGRGALEPHISNEVLYGTTKAEFEETEHPRDDAGKFTDKPGAAAPEKPDPARIATEDPSELASEPRYWTTESAGRWAKQIAMEKFGLPRDAAEKVAARAGDGPGFTVGTEKYPAEGGHFNPHTGEIVAWLDNIRDRIQVQEILAHETFHAKFHVVTDELERQGKSAYDDWKALADAKGSRYADAQMYVKPVESDVLKEPYASKYRLLSEYRKIMEPSDMMKTIAAEGSLVSDYAAKYWKAWNEGKMPTDRALNETLAEVERKKHIMVFYPPRSIGRLHRLFSEEYPKLKAAA